MSSKEPWEPAFPQTVYLEEREHRVNFYGMSLRDYFAAKAMQGAIAGKSFDFSDLANEARTAYGIADAMLKERAK